VRVLVEARKAAGLTQRELAARIGRPYTVIANSVGGAHTGVIELAGLVRRSCSRCGGRRFVTAPAFPSRAVPD